MCTCTSLRIALARASFTLWDLRRPFCTDASSSENTPSVSSSCPSPACLYGSVGTDAQRKQYRSQTRGTEPWRISLPQKCKFCYYLLTLMSLQTHIVNLPNRPKNTFSIRSQQMDSEAFKPQRMQTCCENDWNIVKKLYGAYSSISFHCKFSFLLSLIESHILIFTNDFHIVFLVTSCINWPAELSGLIFNTCSTTRGRHNNYFLMTDNMLHKGSFVLEV